MDFPKRLKRSNSFRSEIALSSGEQSLPETGNVKYEPLQEILIFDVGSRPISTERKTFPPLALTAGLENGGKSSIKRARATEEGRTESFKPLYIDGDPNLIVDLMNHQVLNDDSRSSLDVTPHGERLTMTRRARTATDVGDSDGDGYDDMGSSPSKQAKERWRGNAALYGAKILSLISAWS